MITAAGRSEEETPKVFFCYRRSGTDSDRDGADEDLKEKLHRHLCKALGERAIFRDVDWIKGG